jgi:hypothetical protein
MPQSGYPPWRVIRIFTADVVRDGGKAARAEGREINCVDHLLRVKENQRRRITI